MKNNFAAKYKLCFVEFLYVLSLHWNVNLFFRFLQFLICVLQAHFSADVGAGQRRKDLHC